MTTLRELNHLMLIDIYKLSSVVSVVCSFLQCISILSSPTLIFDQCHTLPRSYFPRELIQLDFFMLFWGKNESGLDWMKRGDVRL